MLINGGCFCGRIRYGIDAPLVVARSCHCSRCRKAFSGAGSAYAEVAPDSFRWVQGENELTRYESVQGFGLCFCSACGTTLCGIVGGNVHGVTLGSVDGDPGVEIAMHIFVGCLRGYIQKPHPGGSGFKGVAAMPAASAAR